MVQRGLLLLLSLLVWFAADTVRPPVEARAATSAGTRLGDDPSARDAELKRLTVPSPDAAENSTDEDDDPSLDTTPDGDKHRACVAAAVRGQHVAPRHWTVTPRAFLNPLAPSVTGDALDLRGPPAAGRS
jgi:hypothetical protein